MAQDRRARWLYMLSLVLAGDSIYLLPYMRQSYQTSMQEVFDVSFTQLGVMNSMFGLLAITAYFAGGWLSDRVATRTLLAGSLFATSAGGFYMATIPSYPMLLALHAFWGITTILTFWAALIKATRLWGTPEDQGRTFGILDAGRGLSAAITFSVAVWLFASFAQAADGLVAVIVLYSSASFVAGFFVLAFIPHAAASGGAPGDGRSGVAEPEDTTEQVPGGQMRRVFRIPAVWMQALIILCAYWLYIGTFEFATFAEKNFQQDKVFGATLSAFREWLRPLAAIGAGLLADRIRPTRAVGAALLICALGYAGLAGLAGEVDLLWMLWIQVAAVAVAVFALRGIYFALMEESRVPVAVTGAAVGLISTIGFMPDIFAYPLSGWFVDSFGAETGYQYYFTLLACVAITGICLTVTLAWLNRVAERKAHSA